MGEFLNVQRSTSNVQRPIADGSHWYSLSRIWDKTLRPSAPYRRLGRGTKPNTCPHPYKNTKYANTKTPFIKQTPHPLNHPIKMAPIRHSMFDVERSMLDVHHSHNNNAPFINTRRQPKPLFNFFIQHKMAPIRHWTLEVERWTLNVNHSHNNNASFINTHRQPEPQFPIHYLSVHTPKEIIPCQ